MRGPNYTILFSILGFLLVGCATVYKPKPYRSISGEIMPVQELSLNEELTIPRGEYVAFVGSKKQYDLLEIKEPLTLKGVFGKHFVDPGFYRKVGEGDYFEYFVPYNYKYLAGGFSWEGTLVQPVSSIGVYKLNGHIVTLAEDGYLSLDDVSTSYDRFQISVPDESTLVSAIVYKGSFDGLASFLYLSQGKHGVLKQEAFMFKNGKDKTLRIHGCEIDLIEIKERYIVCKILSQFDAIE